MKIHEANYTFRANNGTALIAAGVRSQQTARTLLASASLSRAGGTSSAAAMPRAGLPPSGTPLLQPTGAVK